MNFKRLVQFDYQKYTQNRQKLINLTQLNKLENNVDTFESFQLVLTLRIWLMQLLLIQIQIIEVFFKFEPILVFPFQKQE